MKIEQTENSIRKTPLGKNQLLSRDMNCTTKAAEYIRIANFLHSLEWRISYNVLQGHSQDNTEFRSCIPGAEADKEGNLPNYGEFTLTSAPLSGNQETAIQWRSDEGQVTYSLISVSLPR